MDGPFTLIILLGEFAALLVGMAFCAAFPPKAEPPWARERSWRARFWDGVASEPFPIPACWVVGEGNTSQTPDCGEQPYLVYCVGGNGEVRVNTYYLRQGDVILLGGKEGSYDTRLSENLEGFQAMSRQDVDPAAYCCWMSGAR